MKWRLHILSRQSAILCLLCLAGLSGMAQRIGAVTFSKLPQNYQLYPRNEQNEARISISGQVEEADWQSVSVQVFRNKQEVGHKRAALNYTAGRGRFAVEPITIRAEKAEYAFVVYLVKGTDSVRVVDRQNIVAGDVYVLTGQSNASNFFRDTRTNEFCRTFGKTSGTYGADAYDPADTTWAIANQTLLTQNVGTMGFEFQRLILEKYGIPTCLINGAVHWSMMAHHANRNPGNPADLATGYGRMLYRLQKGGIDKVVKALIMRQGESEAYGEGNNWGGNFDIYYRNLKTDLPSIKQLYVFQIDLINPAVAAAPLIRETQRALVDKYLDIQVIPSVGTAGFDGLHYSEEGYIQNAQELTRLVARDFYSSTDVDNIDAPNARKAYYSSEDRTQITLQFNDGQALVWREEFDGLLMKNYFYLDGQAGEIIVGRAVGNRIVLTLKKPSTATRLTYLPPKSDPGRPNTPFQGPYLTNKRGMRALSFYELPIGDVFIEPQPLAAPTLTLAVLSPTAIQLSWNNVPNATAYLLERRDAQSGTFKLLKQLPAGTLTYLADGLADNTTHVFRIKAVGLAVESAWQQVEGKTLAFLAFPELSVSVVYNNELVLNWRPVPGAVSYQIDRRVGAGNFQKLGTFGPTITTTKDTGLEPGTTYMYRIQAFGDKTESSVFSVNGITPGLLSTPAITLTVLYNNSLTVNWKAISGASTYQLDRKLAGRSYERVGTFGPETVAFADTTLQPGAVYSYRLKALARVTESISTNADVQMPALLPTPTLSSSVIYNNIVEVNWTLVTNAKAYQLERLNPGRWYQKIGLFTAGALAFRDTNLTPGAAYTYRLTAIGDKTESPVVSVSTVTPDRLVKVELVVTPASYDAMNISWKVVPNATYYLLERRTAGAVAYEQPIRLNAQQTEYTDAQLTPNTAYQYRITAYGDKTKSDPVLVEGRTLVLLAVGQDPSIEFGLWPNPVIDGQVLVLFSMPVTGTLQLVDLRGVVLVEQVLSSTDQLPFSVVGYAAGVYLVRVKQMAGMLVKKLIIR